MHKKVIIIGSGIAGLASAIRLSNYGYSVIVLSPIMMLVEKFLK